MKDNQKNKTNNINMLLISMIISLILSSGVIIALLYFSIDDKQKNNSEIKTEQKHKEEKKQDEKPKEQEMPKIKEQDKEDTTIKKEKKEETKSSAYSIHGEKITKGEFIYFSSKMFDTYQFESASLEHLLKNQDKLSVPYENQKELKTYKYLMDVAWIQEYMKPEEDLTTIFGKEFKEAEFITQEEVKSFLHLYIDKEVSFNEKRTYIYASDIIELEKFIKKELSLKYKQRY